MYLGAMDGLLVRNVVLEDFDSIYRFVCELEDQIFDKQEMRACFDACIEAANHIYLLAEQDSQPIGYISCHGQILMHHCGWVYEIQELYVSPGYRGKGVGAKLVAGVESILKDKDCKSLEVTSNIRRAEAHRFYEGTGYKRTSYKFVKDKLS